MKEDKLHITYIIENEDSELMPLFVSKKVLEIGVQRIGDILFEDIKKTIIISAQSSKKMKEIRQELRFALRSAKDKKQIKQIERLEKITGDVEKMISDIDDSMDSLEKITTLFAKMEEDDVVEKYFELIMKKIHSMDKGNKLKELAKADKITIER